MLLRSGTALQSNSAMKPIADPTVLLDTVCVEIGTKEQGKKKKKNKKKKGANKPQTPVIQSFAQCSKCEEAFTDVAAFNAHVIGSHPFLRPMYCVVADTAKDLYPCEECKMFIVPFPGFKTKGDLFLCFHCRLQCLGQWGCCGCGFLSDEVPDYIPDDDKDDLCADCQQRDDLFKKNSTSTSIPTTNTSTSTTTSSSTSIEPTTSTSSTPSSTSATHPPTSSPLSLASQSAVEGAASLDLERVSSICCSLKEKIADPLPLSSIDEGVPSNFRRDSQKDPEARPVPSSLTPATLTSSTMPSIDHSSSTTSDIAKTSIPASDTHVPRSDPQPHPDISESTTPPVSTTPDSSLPATDTFASTGAQERTSVRSYAQAVSGGSRSSSPTSLPHRSASRERQRQSYSANPVQPKGLDGPSAHGKPTQRDKTRPPTLTIPDNPPAPTQASSKTAAKVSPGASPATTPAKPISCAREAYGKTATTGSYSFPYFSSFSSYCDNSSFFIPKPPVTLGEMRDGLYAAYSHLYGRPVFLGYLKFIDTI